MIVALIIACEVGFWVLLALALAVRYLLKKRRTSVVLLLCEPVLELVLFVVTAIDLKNGAEPSWEHGIAALYIGFTVGYGHYMIGLARARYEGKLWVRTVVAAGVALVLLQLAVWYVGDDGNVDSLRSFQWLALRGAGIHGLVALAYTIWPKKDPAASDTGERVTVEKERAGR